MNSNSVSSRNYIIPIISSSVQALGGYSSNLSTYANLIMSTGSAQQSWVSTRGSWGGTAFATGEVYSHYLWVRIGNPYLNEGRMSTEYLSYGNSSCPTIEPASGGAIIMQISGEHTVGEVKLLSSKHCVISGRVTAGRSKKNASYLRVYKVVDKEGWKRIPWSKVEYLKQTLTVEELI